MPQPMIIVIIFIAAVFIVVSILRGGDERPRNLRQRPRPGEPRQRPTNDITRFLEEVNRLRQAPPVEPEYRAEPPPRPVLVVPPPELPRRPIPIIRERPRMAPPPPREPAILDALPALAPVPAPSAAAGPAKTAPAVMQLREMLRSPQSLRAAILLQEVLGPPRCRKPQR